MNIKKLTYIFILVLLILSCNKQNEQIDLVADYLTVSDVLQYCQGSCEEKKDWEDQEILAKGHIMSIQNDSIYLDYYDKSSFYFEDIRNGLFMEIRVTNQKNEIFEILSQVQNQDMVFIRGIAASILVSDGTSCTKGVFIELSEAQNIQINL